MGFAYALNCCDCPPPCARIILCVSLNGCGGSLDGAGVTVKGPAPATTTVGTCTTATGIAPGSGNYTSFCCISLPAFGVYTVSVSGLPSGYYALSDWTVDVELCGWTSTGKTACNTTASVRVQVSSCDATGAVEGATVSLSGGGVSGTGTTDASGVATIAATMPAGGDCSGAAAGFLSGVTLGVTPPAGSGLLSATQSLASFNRCGEALTAELGADGDHICECNCGYPIPRSLTYTDTYGSCTITYDDALGYWVGTLSYACDCMQTGAFGPCPQDPYAGLSGRQLGTDTAPFVIVMTCNRTGHGTGLGVHKIPPGCELPAAQCGPCVDCEGVLWTAPDPDRTAPLGGTLAWTPTDILPPVGAVGLTLDCPGSGGSFLVTGRFDTKLTTGQRIACTDTDFSIMP